MACTAPMNIVKNVKNICDNKCNYSFLYPMTNLVVSNRTKYIEFKCNLCYRYKRANYGCKSMLSLW